MIETVPIVVTAVTVMIEVIAMTVMIGIVAMGITVNETTVIVIAMIVNVVAVVLDPPEGEDVAMRGIGDGEGIGINSHRTRMR